MMCTGEHVFGNKNLRFLLGVYAEPLESCERIDAGPLPFTLCTCV